MFYVYAINGNALMVKNKGVDVRTNCIYSYQVSNFAIHLAI